MKNYQSYECLSRLPLPNPTLTNIQLIPFHSLSFSLNIISSERSFLATQKLNTAGASPASVSHSFGFEGPWGYVT